MNQRGGPFGHIQDSAKAKCGYFVPDGWTPGICQGCRELFEPDPRCNKQLYCEPCRSHNWALLAGYVESFR